VNDSRGTFIKFQPANEIKEGLDSVALSLNPKIGTLRGMHFQLEPFAEEKLVTCIQGSIFDVAVDLRPNSITLGKWVSFDLSATNALQIYLPKGIAHGFQTLSPNSIVHYSIRGVYAPELSCAINPLGDLNITWPIKEILISERDAGGITLVSAAKKFAESLLE
jgi:dTDP-4-dehydrorhamnose 3,5-epimerase